MKWLFKNVIERNNLNGKKEFKDISVRNAHDMASQNNKQGTLHRTFPRKEGSPNSPILLIIVYTRNPFLYLPRVELFAGVVILNPSTLICERHVENLFHYKSTLCLLCLFLPLLLLSLKTEILFYLLCFFFLCSSVRASQHATENQSLDDGELASNWREVMLSKSHGRMFFFFFSFDPGIFLEGLTAAIVCECERVGRENTYKGGPVDFSPKVFGRRFLWDFEVEGTFIKWNLFRVWMEFPFWDLSVQKIYKYGCVTVNNIYCHINVKSKVIYKLLLFLYKMKA